MAGSLAALRDAHWLTRDRVTALTRVLLLVLAGFLAVIPWAAPTMNVGHDFAAFWTSARLALDGHGASAYGEAERAALAALFGPGRYPPLFYPPPALLLWLPFALLPFAAAVAVWLAASGTAYALAMRALLKGAVVPALAFPAVTVCALYGQNSLFSAALLGGAAATLQRSPLIAGALIGLLAYKPQLAILAPLVFIAARRWRAFAAAAVTVLLFAGAAALAFGIDAWTAFIHALPAARAWNASGAPGFATFASPYAAIRQLGGSANVAWLVQAAIAAAAIAALVFTAWKRPSETAEIALMAAATGLCVPFLGVYDMAIFAVPGAWLIAEAMAKSWLPYERAALAVLYISPLIIVPASVHGVPLAPLAEAALLILVVRRMWRARQPMKRSSQSESSGT
jgi:Glycosyltransferase family 87